MSPEEALIADIQAVLLPQLADPADKRHVGDMAKAVAALFAGPFERIEHVLAPVHAWGDEADREMAAEWAERAFQAGLATANYRLSGVLQLYHRLLGHLHKGSGCSPWCVSEFHTPLVRKRPSDGST